MNEYKNKNKKYTNNLNRKIKKVKKYIKQNKAKQKLNE